MVKTQDVRLYNLLSFSLTGGHTNTERGYLPILSQTLRDGLAQDPETNGQFRHHVAVSRADAHPLKIA